MGFALFKNYKIKPIHLLIVLAWAYGAITCIKQNLFTLPFCFFPFLIPSEITIELSSKVFWLLSPFFRSGGIVLLDRPIGIQETDNFVFIVNGLIWATPFILMSKNRIRLFAVLIALSLITSLLIIFSLPTTAEIKEKELSECLRYEPDTENRIVCVTKLAGKYLDAGLCDRYLVRECNGWGLFENGTKNCYSTTTKKCYTAAALALHDPMICLKNEEYEVDDCVSNAAGGLDSFEPCNNLPEKYRMTCFITAGGRPDGSDCEKISNSTYRDYCLRRVAEKNVVSYKNSTPSECWEKRHCNGYCLPSHEFDTCVLNFGLKNVAESEDSGVSICNKIAEGDIRDNCLMKIADEIRGNSWCGQIMDWKERESCILNVSVESLRICDNIPSTSWAKGECENLIISDRDFARLSFAESNGNISMCDQIESDNYRLMCQAYIEENSSKCYSFYVHDKDSCIKEIFLKTKDKKYCDELPLEKNPSNKQWCLNYK